MMSFVRNLLILLSIAVSSCHGFTSTSLPIRCGLTNEIQPISGHITSSRKGATGKNNACVRSTFYSSVSSSKMILMMTSATDEDDGSSQKTTESTTPLKNKKEQVVKKNEGRKNALLILPLFFKFMIVLMVKFLTDVVVYPFLFLYRFLRVLKNKMLSFFKGPTANGDTGGDYQI
mmetsp:Transcript_41244/g.50178  ORF Transcript_41244/g.50178 Transcript_41244/m.50178 type:complete len:175 (-) Transcript_41244:77-601(-)